MVVEQTWLVSKTLVPRDGAFLALTELTRDAYEKETHRNNAELLPTGFIRMIKAVPKGEEILVTYGWEFHQRRAHAMGGGAS